MAQCEATGKIPGRPNFGKQCQRHAVTGSTTCVVHGGTSTTSTPDKVRHRKDRGGTQCCRIKKDGEQCRQYAVPGTTVCRYHGGKAPQTKAKARERMLEMISPALAQLDRILTKSDTTDADRLRAITLLLDRTGYGPKAELEVEVKQWEQTLQGILKTPPLELRQQLPALEAALADRDQASAEDELDDSERPPVFTITSVGSANPPKHQL